ncbi:hypothetical protein CWN07_12115 [Klebsiella quasipneumoniae]|nr:hypothetical protein CWN07_12115 [Klebsiella quasipneumoniae]
MGQYKPYRFIGVMLIFFTPPRIIVEHNAQRIAACSAYDLTKLIWNKMRGALANGAWALSDSKAMSFAETHRRCAVASASLIVNE